MLKLLLCEVFYICRTYVKRNCWLLEQLFNNVKIFRQNKTHQVVCFTNAGTYCRLNSYPRHKVGSMRTLRECWPSSGPRNQMFSSTVKRCRRVKRLLWNNMLFYKNSLEKYLFIVVRYFWCALKQKMSPTKVRAYSLIPNSVASNSSWPNGSYDSLK